ncbi:serine/arginine repetitive matrix protein 2 [Echeneis naucrates]|uniref:serine/arginine repetitive matrix protein 2 n=1 Tax=Echeneis naucrates TaxID=173247 RepID=UPI0011134B8F|nr:serine/arginine repetitive matrix protein 2-like [Echeneis naucrates]
MDSWTLQGDSYSFLRSAPHTFSLCHRDGTPNHVEIFDIINVPSQRSAISETTCLCDIFGDDCESPSHSSSPAVGAFVPSQREVGGRAAASPLADDLNDSSGSYHTAQGSSEGEEGFEDSRERLYSPLSQSTSSEKEQAEGEALSPGHPDILENTRPNLEPNRKSPVTRLSITPSEVLNTCERTPSPGHNSSYNINPEERASPLSSSSVEKRLSPSLSNLEKTHPEPESGKITPTVKHRLNSLSLQSLSASPSSECNCVSVVSSESVHTESSPEFRIAQNSPEPKGSYINQQSCPSPEQFSPDCTEQVFESSAATLSTPLSSSSASELSHSRETLSSPDLKNRPYSPDSRTSSPASHRQGRVSLPDLFNSSSTPDIEESPCSPGLISDPSAARRDTSVTPESQSARLSVETVSTASTPAPRYTPPSPVISIATSPELIGSSISPELRHTVPSPARLEAASLANTGSRPTSRGSSSKIRHLSSPSEINTPVSSPVVSYSLSPSPGGRSTCSPIEHRHTAPSPEIRITASSPEPHFDSASSRHFTSSPHITGISYSVVQPEDRETPPFPELNRLTTESDRALVSPESKSPTQRRDSVQSTIAGSAGSPRDSPHISGFTSPTQQPSVSVLHQQKCQTPSPQPKHHSPSPVLRYQTPISDSNQSLSLQHLRNRDPSPVPPPPEQIPTVTLSTGCLPHPTPPLRHTPDVERDSPTADIVEIQYPENLAKDMSSSFELDRGDKSITAEIQSSSPLATDCLPVLTLPISAEQKIETPLKYQSIEQETTQTEVNSGHNSSSFSFSEEKQNPGHSFFEKEGSYNKPINKIKSPSLNISVSKDRSPTISTVPGGTSDPPVQIPENPHPQFTTYAQTSETKSFCIPEHSGRLLSTQATREHRERLTEDMAHHSNRRRTPSPPLTRFTPVHIIAPEKPYRQWQNRSQSQSPSQVVASSPSGHLKKAVTNRESPNVVPVDNNSQAHWVRPGGQLEMERDMQLEEEREVGKGRLRNREMERERKREERVPEKGEGWQGDGSYRGEQVELSFNARNRKGPVSRRAAPTNRDSRQGLPAVHSYPESSLAPRQLQQQQSLLRRVSQQDTWGGGPSRRLQPPAHQNKNRGRVAASRPCPSSSSSMGSEFDEEDHEVKWFTDLAFHSLSSPEVDYLDVYNSSHHSSANISQPSTQGSPSGVNSTWQAYADFRGFGPKTDSDDFSFQQSSACYSDGLNPSRRYEMGSFECVDVAVEREDTRKMRRGVPKRQIQLKRKDNAEGRQEESSEDSSPGIPVMMESPSPKSHPRETFVRQYSTPATTQSCYLPEPSPQPDQRKCQLQKSASLDETCSKTKMATCLIKSVLSKKMQSVDKQTDEQTEEINPAFEETSLLTESVGAPRKSSPKPDTHYLSSSLSSDCGFSSDGFLMRGDPSPRHDVKPSKSFGVRSSNRPSSSSSSRSVIFSQTDSEEADSQSRNAISLKSEMRSEYKMQFDSEQSTTSIQQADDIKTWGEREACDSAHSSAGNTGAPCATGGSGTQAWMTNRDQECENKETHKQRQQSGKGAHKLKTQDITLRAVEKKKASLSVQLTPEAENKLESSSPEMTVREKSERVENSVDEITEGDGENGNSKVKAPIHKVRDVRRLVKNTYNLSFKATSAEMRSDEETVEIFNGNRREEIKEERRKEITEVEEQEVRQEMRMGEKREEREEAHRVERKVEQKEEVRESKLPTESPPLQSKGKLQSHPQPIQIEYKAVCWKENKNKMLCNKKDSENLCDKPQAFQELASEVSRASQKSLTAGDTAISKLSQHDLKKATEKQESVTEIQEPDKEGKAVAVKTDRRPPMLGSLPRVPSKEREVSTAVVLIRDGSSKTKASASPAQEEIPAPVPAASISVGPTPPNSTTSSSSHSVSMLMKEKGYQADIGAVVGDGQNGAAVKGAPRKHVNCLEIPLQTTMPSEAEQTECPRERKFSASSATSAPSAVSEKVDTLTKTPVEVGVCTKPTVKDTVKQKSTPPSTNAQEQTPPPTKPRDLGDFESVKRLDPTFPPRSPAVRRFRPQPIEVKSLSKDTQKQEKPANSAGSNRPQTIEVKSIAKNSQKPVVPPKPTCKFKHADLGTMPNEAQRLSVTTSAVKPQGEERCQTIVVSSPTIYRKISNESTSTSNYTRKLAVSAVSSLKPPPSKTTATAISNLSNQSTAPSETEAANDQGQQQQPAASPQSSRYSQRPTTSALTSGISTTAAAPPAPDPEANQMTEPPSAGVNQPRQPAVMGPANQPQDPSMMCPHEQALLITSNTIKQPTAVPTTQLPGYTHQQCRRSLSSERRQRTDNACFYASDDPPSYDERESFSPLVLPDLTPRRSIHYQPSYRPPPCSCTAGCPSHPGHIPPHQHRSPSNLTPPGPPHSPGQALPYPVAQPPLRPHQCRSDTQPISYQRSSPKSSTLGPSQPPALYQPLHQPPPCPPHPSLLQACAADRPLQPAQHIDPRRPPLHRSPQQQPPAMAGAPYNDSGHSHSPALAPMDPQYLSGPQSLGPSYASEYGGDSSSLYSESNYGQTPRRVLLDPETGKYFYIEVPLQPLRKMLFDPETGQYVEVLIPQQAMSQSGLYPPSAAPYPSLHNPNMYAPSPQYMPYPAPPPAAHPQHQPQPPRYPEAATAATMHPSGPVVSYRNHSGQGSKPEPQNSPPMDQSYLESMYYVPIGMNASPNTTPPDYYHKHPPNLPPTGGKRS